MRFSHARKAAKLIRSKSLQKDVLTAIARIEKSASKEAGGRAASLLIGFAYALRETLPKNARFSLMNGVFEDAENNGLVHEWERVYDRECTSQGCTKVREGWKCLRNTDTNECASGAA